MKKLSAFALIYTPLCTKQLPGKDNQCQHDELSGRKAGSTLLKSRIFQKPSANTLKLVTPFSAKKDNSRTNLFLSVSKLEGIPQQSPVPIISAHKATGHGVKYKLRAVSLYKGFFLGT